MSRYLKQLWNDAGPGGPCPRISPADIQRRVDAALEQAPIERNRFMKQKLRLGAALCALLLVLAGAALALSRYPDLLYLFFPGDSSVAEPYVQTPGVSVSDGQFTFTLQSSVSDGRHTLLLVTVEALTDEAKTRLFADDFEGMDTFHYVYEEGYATPGGISWGDEEDVQTDSARTFSLNVETEGSGKLGLWLDVMSKDARLDIPQGEDMGSAVLGSGETVTTPEGQSYTVDSVLLTPMSLQLKTTWVGPKGFPTPNILFRMADGSILSQSAVLRFSSWTLTSPRETEPRAGVTDYSMNSVLNLSQVSALIIEDKEFPLDGGPSKAADVDPRLYVFYLPLGEKAGEELGFTIPVDALCQKLGAEYIWDEGAGTLTATYRDITLVFTENNPVLLVNGEARTLEAAPVRSGDMLYAAYYFQDWNIYPHYTGTYGEKSDLWEVIP